MTDIRKHFKRIIKVVRKELSALNNQSVSLVTTDEIKTKIKHRLIDFLPPSFGVGSGKVITKKGNTSKPLDIIIYHKSAEEKLPRQRETYIVSHVQFVLEVKLIYNEETLIDALEKIKSVKELKLAQKNSKTQNLLLPYSIICFYQGQREEKDREKFFDSLKKKLQGYEASGRPDYVFSLAHSASYTNPVLRGETDTKCQIGFSLEPELKKPITCHICKQKFTQRHFFYSRLCIKCGDFNYCKRNQYANLENFTALVTGARVKIGYEVALKLLRDGARVIVTTRFPHDAAWRYSQEADFEVWCNRLHIYGVDFRHIPSVEYFITHLKTVYDRLEIIINNAAQTIRKPPAYYAHLIAFESLHISQRPREIQPLIKSFLPANQQIFSDSTSSLIPVTSLAANNSTQEANCSLNFSALLSQVALLPEDKQQDINLFPPGIYDADCQQLDKRTHNSWRMKLDEVSTTELLEVYLINAIVPSMFNSQLKALMLQSPAKSKYIINVTAMEGKFNYPAKPSRHPHTNMAKAALNMMTRTSARDYARDNIFMSSVDTGWITNENPYHIAREMEALGFQLPLDAKDAAARICDPIYVGINSGRFEYGNFLKNYLVTDW
jgi:NAD(P)-dependent dehydrogenase (short-subunit alcohol dehydrogenase family)